MAKDISEISTHESAIVQAAAHRTTVKVLQKFLSNYGLTSTQWSIIGLSYNAGDKGVRLKDLMATLDTSMPFITSTVNLLEVKGIVDKVNDPNDNRIKSAVLKPSYRLEVEKIENKLRNVLRQELYAQDNITREELDTYITVLYKIARANKPTGRPADGKK